MPPWSPSVFAAIPALSTYPGSKWSLQRTLVKQLLGTLKIKVPKGGFYSDAIEEPFVSPTFSEQFLKGPFFS